MFWKRKETKDEQAKLPGPKGIPDVVGRYLVVEEKKGPDWVWSLKGVVLPTEKETAFYCRVFDETQAVQAGVKVKNWTSLDDHPGLILWEGYFDKKTFVARREKFVKKPDSATESLLEMGTKNS